MEQARTCFTGWWDAAAHAPRRVPGHGGRPADGRRRTSCPTSSTPRCRPGPSAPSSWRSARMGRSWIPVRRDWRLNERHYGDLTGRNKAETAARYGADQVKVWRRSYDVPPPPIRDDNPFNPNGDERYATGPGRCPAPHRVPGGRRRAPAPVLGRSDRPRPARRTHGARRRPRQQPPGLVKHLDEISDDDIVELNIPTGRAARLRARRRPAAGRPPCRSRSAICAAPRRSVPRPRRSRDRQRASDPCARWNNGARQDHRRRCFARNSASADPSGRDDRGAVSWLSRAACSTDREVTEPEPAPRHGEAPQRSALLTEDDVPATFAPAAESTPINADPRPGAPSATTPSRSSSPRRPPASTSPATRSS